MIRGNLTTEWASLLIDTFVQAGVTDVVISPGSRSTPLVWAAIQTRELRSHRIVDERSAAFFAVGQSKMTGRPTLLICTSGTAGAHYYPALIEAAQSSTPLLIVTADRPGELQGCGAPQTIDQTDLYGRHARAYINLGPPEPREAALRALRSNAERAYGISLFPTPGPVHLNAPFRKPLEPGDAKGDEERRLADIAAALRNRPVRPTARPGIDREGVESAVREIVQIAHDEGAPLIACGPVSPSAAGNRNAVIRHLSRLPFPVFAEATSQLRFGGNKGRSVFCDGFDTFLRVRSVAEHRPPAIIRIGAPLVSKGWDIFSATVDAPSFVVAEHRWDDPHHSGARFVRSPSDYFLQRLEEQLEGVEEASSGGILERYQTASRTTAEVLADLIPTGDKPLTPGAAARTILSALPPRSLLALSNSLPVRDIDMFTARCKADLVIWSQRGVNGIDGLISGAAGAAAAMTSPHGKGRGATLYVGDVAFLHDLSSLAVASRIDSPFAIVVAANRGGRIFEQLPIAQHPGMDESSLEWWTTPHNIDIADAATLFRIPFEKAKTGNELESALKKAHSFSGCSIIEACIDPATIVVEQEGLKKRVLQILE